MCMDSGVLKVLHQGHRHACHAEIVTHDLVQVQHILAMAVLYASVKVCAWDGETPSPLNLWCGVMVPVDTAQYAEAESKGCHTGR